MTPDIEAIPSDEASDGGSDDLEMDEDITVVGDIIPQRAIGCLDEVAVVLQWATDKDQKRVRRYLETDSAADGKWSLTKFRSDACAWPDASPHLTYGAHPARVCTVAQLVSGDFSMSLESPPSFIVEFDLLREVDRAALSRLKVRWGGQNAQHRRVKATRKLAAHCQTFENFFWAGERMAPPGKEPMMGFTSLRPGDLVYVECWIGREDDDVALSLDVIQFIARPPHNL